VTCKVKLSIEPHVGVTEKRLLTSANRENAGSFTLEVFSRGDEGVGTVSIAEG